MKFIYKKSGEKHYETFISYKTKASANNNNIIFEIKDTASNKMIRIWCKDNKSYEALDHFVDIANNDICNLCDILNKNEYSIL